MDGEDVDADEKDRDVERRHQPAAAQEVVVGVRSDSYYEVLSGLKEGDRVVTSGNFLLSSESRLKSATGLW